MLCHQFPAPVKRAIWVCCLAFSVCTIHGLHSLGLVLAQAFQKFTPPAQSSPLITLDLKFPAASVCQHVSLSVPVEEKTEAGISMSSPFVSPVWSTYCTAHYGGLPENRQPPLFGYSKLSVNAYKSWVVIQSWLETAPLPEQKWDHLILHNEKSMDIKYE